MGHIQAQKTALEKPKTILIDAKNELNSLNRQLPLKNNEKLCTSLSDELSNLNKPPSLFVNGENHSIPTTKYPKESLGKGDV